VSAQERPSPRWIVASLLALAVAGTTVYLGTRREPAAEPRALLDGYCVGCHNEAERAGDLTLERLLARTLFCGSPAGRSRSRSPLIGV
jgi:hypothetical protein